MSELAVMTHTPISDRVHQRIAAVCRLRGDAPLDRAVMSAAVRTVARHVLMQNPLLVSRGQQCQDELHRRMVESRRALLTA